MGETEDDGWDDDEAEAYDDSQTPAVETHLPEVTWTLKDERSWRCGCGATGSLFSGPTRLADAEREAYEHVTASVLAGVGEVA